MGYIYPRAPGPSTPASPTGTMPMSPAILCLIASLLPAASGSLWAWMYSLPQHLPDEAALGRSASPGDNLEEVRSG